MRGLPRPDVKLAFLRPDQVAQQLEELEGGEAEQYPEGVEEDEDGIDTECVRNEDGERELDSSHVDPPVDDGSMLYDSDSDDPELSEYEDRRRLRQEEKKHEKRQEQLGLLRRSLRIEQQAFHKSMPHRTRGPVTIEDDDDEGDAIQVPSHDDVSSVMERYDERLARVDEEIRLHAQAASGLFQQQELSAEQARSRQWRRIEARRARDAQARLEEEQKRREQEQAEAEQARRAQEEEEARARAEEVRVQLAIAVERKQARLEQKRMARRRHLWLASTRDRAQREQRGRRILGELSMEGYPGEEGEEGED
jgi:hypothetical protein